MRWQRVIGQEHAKELLIAAIKNGTLAHAYCFWGPEGVGKDALAIEFARVLNCRNPHITSSSIEACNHCRDCRQMANLQHPNLQFIFSLPAASKPSSDEEDSPLFRLSDEQISLIQEQLLLKARNPYHNITLPNATQIRIASIRDIRRKLQLTPALDHGWRVVIISEADCMTIEAANAFLKTIEEPHSQTTLILTTSRRELLPPTILSRCQHIHCGNLSEDEIASALIERENIAPDRARIIAALAQGSYARALEIALSTDHDETTIETMLNFLRTALKSSRYRTELIGFIEHHLSVLDRQQLSVALQLLLAWLHDAHRLQLVGANARPYLVFRSGNAYQALLRFVRRYHTAPLEQAIAAVEEALAAVEANAQIPLTFSCLAIRLRKILSSQLVSQPLSP